MAYASAQDMIDRFSAQQLREATDPEASEIRAEALERALEDASGEIDGYLEGRYRLPLPKPPPLLKLFACDIAMYRLLTLRPIDAMEDQRKRYEDVKRFLLSVSKSEINLGPAESGETATPAGGPTLVAGPERVFSRQRMRGF